jgi:NAD(P)-dependent dehydrogenase (short-subunit alcohol dehydrogenase family)
MDRSTWLITGASSGIGYALAEHVLETQRAEYDAGKELAFSTDYPDATGPTVL